MLTQCAKQGWPSKPDYRVRFPHKIMTVAILHSSGESVMINSPSMHNPLFRLSTGFADEVRDVNILCPRCGASGGGHRAVISPVLPVVAFFAYKAPVPRIKPKRGIRAANATHVTLLLMIFIEKVQYRFFSLFAKTLKHAWARPLEKSETAEKSGNDQENNQGRLFRSWKNNQGRLFPKMTYLVLRLAITATYNNWPN